MRIKDLQDHVGGKIMRSFNSEVNKYSKFLSLCFDVKPSKKAIELIESNGWNIKEVKWTEVSEHKAIMTTKWEAMPNNIADYEFMGFWEPSGARYKHYIIDEALELGSEWISLDQLKAKVEEIAAQYNTSEYDLNYTNGNDRNCIYGSWNELKQDHLSAAYWAGIELMYKYIGTEYQEGKRPRIKFDRSVY